MKEQKGLSLKLMLVLAFIHHATALLANDISVKNIHLPKVFPNPTEKEIAEGIMSIEISGQKKATTIIPQIQSQLIDFIQKRNLPISAVILAEVKSGKILAFVQGRDPNYWDSENHTALHPDFPCASIFKTVVTAAAFEFTNLDQENATDLDGGCANIDPAGRWMIQNEKSRNEISFRSAFGMSCNEYFAKIAITSLGVGPIVNMAQRLGWGEGHITSDFYVPNSPFKIPNPEYSSTSTVGKFAAGFGNVGMTAAHAVWQTIAIANDGLAKPLQIFLETENLSNNTNNLRVMSQESSTKLREIMTATTSKGTAAFAFNQGPYRSLKTSVGGKTGTLSGTNPKGITSWFVGMMPIEKPEVVVAAVVLLEDQWRFKAPNLAAEALYAYKLYQNNTPSNLDHTKIAKKADTKTILKQ